MKPRYLLDALHDATIRVPQFVWLLVAFGIGLAWGRGNYECGMAFVVGVVIAVLLFALMTVKFPELRKVEEKEKIGISGYIYAYDPVVKKRVVHVVKRGWAISMVTGNKFRYVEKKEAKA